MKKFIPLSMLFLGLVILGIFIFGEIYSNYQYDNTIKSYWDIADKTSTISKKSEYIDKFVSALQEAHLNGVNDSLILKTPNKSFDQNFQALQSLQDRLHQIKTMDETSFAYQTAIQQITQQEQGQAQDMLDNFQNCWIKVNYYWLWNPIISILLVGGAIMLMILGVAIFTELIN